MFCVYAINFNFTFLGDKGLFDFKSFVDIFKYIIDLFICLDKSV